MVKTHKNERNLFFWGDIAKLSDFNEYDSLINKEEILNTDDYNLSILDNKVSFVETENEGTVKYIKSHNILLLLPLPSFLCV